MGERPTLARLLNGRAPGHLPVAEDGASSEATELYLSSTVDAGAEAAGSSLVVY